MPTPTQIFETAGDGRRAPINSDNTFNFIRTFRVVYDEPVFDLAEVAGAKISESVRLPRKGEPYSTQFSKATVRVIDPTDVNDEGCVFDVRVEYSSEGSSSNRDNPDNPLKRPWKVSFSFDFKEKTLERAKSSIGAFNESVAVATIAGEKFDPPLVQQETFTLVRMVKNMANFPTALARETVKSMNKNKTNVAGIDVPELHAFMRSITSGDKQKENDVEFYAVTFEVLIAGQIQNQNVNYVPKNTARNKVSPFDTEILHAGYRAFYVNSPGSSDADEVTINNKKPSKPVLLNDEGAYDPEAQKPENASYIVFRTFEAKDWKNLGLPVNQGGV